MIRAYKLRFYPTRSQARVLVQWFGHSRWVWNWALGARRKAYARRGETLSSVDLSRILTRIKRSRSKGWLGEVPSSCLAQKLRDLDTAYRNAFEGRARPPRFFAPPAPVAALALGVTVPAASRVLIPAPRRAQRFTPSGAAATCSAKALAPVAARADEHLAPASGTQKQAGIVHCSPRRGGLDDPRLPGNTALGAVRQCGSGRSLGRDRQVDVVRGCAGLPDHCDLTPTAERRHHTGAPRRHLLIGNIGSGGRQPQAPGRGTGTTQSSSAPIPQSQFTRAVRRITALSQSRLHHRTPFPVFTGF